MTETDGYRAVQVAAGTRRASRVTKPMAGHYAKAGVAAGAKLGEFRLAEGEGADLEVGRGDHGFDLRARPDGGRARRDQGPRLLRRGPAPPLPHPGRDPRQLACRTGSTGSIGQNQTPGRVFKGKKMAGHLGSVQRCQQNLEVVRVDAERNLLLVRGGVPGPTGGHLVVLPSVKQKNKG